MKKLIIVVVSLMITVSSFAGYTNDMINRMETKEKSVEESFEGSNVEMKEATSVILKGWDSELNKVYKLLMKKLSKSGKIKLINEEKLWIKSRDDKAKEIANEFCDTVNGERLCGTGYGLAYIQSIVESTKDRAVELSKRYEKLK